MLLNKHGPDKLYQVTSDTGGCKDMDLTLQRGQIVAFLHGMDSKGNTNRWLVDSGGIVSLATTQNPFLCTDKGAYL